MPMVPNVEIHEESTILLDRSSQLWKRIESRSNPCQDENGRLM